MSAAARKRAVTSGRPRSSPFQGEQRALREGVLDGECEIFFPRQKIPVMSQPSTQGPEDLAGTSPRSHLLLRHLVRLRGGLHRVDEIEHIGERLGGEIARAGEVGVERGSRHARLLHDLGDGWAQIAVADCRHARVSGCFDD